MSKTDQLQQIHKLENELDFVLTDENEFDTMSDEKVLDYIEWLERIHLQSASRN